MSEMQNHQRELETKLWAMANNLRGTMEAYEFKNYILGMIFYYYLSKREEDYMVNLLKDDGVGFNAAWEDPEYKEAVIEEALRDLGYIIEPQYLFRNMVRMVETNNFDIEFLQAAINSIMESTMGADSQEDFENLFDDMQLDSTKLGRTVKDRSAVMGRIIATLADIGIDMEDTNIDVLGNAYEYLIGQFAATAGKKAGEFYTPAGPAELLCRLACDGLTDVKEACDPTCGSGSLLLRLQNYANVRMFFGQELTAQTYNLARMNMILRGVPYRNFQIFNGDTLVNDNFGGHKFRVQVANPPYSAKLANPTAMADDPRFNEYGKLVPDSKADLAFVQHMVYHMDDDGRIAVLLPHGALFRMKSEDTIRRYLIEKLNVIDAVIGLPSNLFFGTGIPVVVLVLKKNRNGNADNICFIDASREYEKGNKSNYLTSDNIEKILAAYRERKDIRQYCHVAPISEVAANEFKLNILAYVKLEQEDDNVNAPKAAEELQEAQRALLAANEQLDKYAKELGIPDFGPETLRRVMSGKLRFKKDNGSEYEPWKTVHLYEILEEQHNKSDGKLRICSVAVNEGVVDQIEHLGRSFAAADTSNYGMCWLSTSRNFVSKQWGERKIQMGSS
jgi:type I restriction enzyme M protein